jgi:DNA replication protein DnaC
MGTITTKLSELRLLGFSEELEEQSTNSAYADLSFEERLDYLLDAELARRSGKALQRRLSMASLQRDATIERFDWSEGRGIDKPLCRELSNCKWIDKHLNIIINGATGCGKTYLASALGEKACRKGYSVRLFKSHCLAESLVAARVDGSYRRLFKSLQKTDVIIFDEWLRDVLPEAHVRELLDLIDERYSVASHIFVTQQPVNKWHGKLTDQTLADALLDRVVHDAYKVQLKGESMRKLRATKK